MQALRLQGLAAATLAAGRVYLLSPGNGVSGVDARERVMDAVCAWAREAELEHARGALMRAAVACDAAVGTPEEQARFDEWAELARASRSMPPSVPDEHRVAPELLATLPGEGG